MGPALSQLASLVGFVTQLRSLGVRTFKGEFDGKPIEVELGPAPEGAPATTTLEDDTERCRCGHGPHEHGGGFCLLGCEVEKCLNPEDKQ